MKFTEADGRTKIRKLSARFQNYPSVLTVARFGDVPDRHAVLREYRRLAVAARARLRADRDHRARRRPRTAPTCSSFDTFEAVDDTGLPNDEVMLAAIDRVANDLSELLKAPEVEPFVGPAIFSGRPRACSSTKFSATAWKGTGRRTRAKGRPSPRASGRRCCRISFPWCSIRRAARSAGIDLNGWYDYDDEGVKARPVTVVDKGVLKTFLMSRSPIQGFRSFQRTRPAAGGPGSGVAAVQPDRGIHQRGARGEAAADARRRGQEAGQAVRAVLPRGHRRVHHHAARPGCRRSK